MAQMYRILGKRGRITIPYEIRQRVGFSQNDVLSFTESPDGRTVLVKREKLCDDNSYTTYGGSSGSETGDGGGGGNAAGSGSSNMVAAGVTMQIVYYRYDQCYNRYNSHGSVVGTLQNGKALPWNSTGKDNGSSETTVFDTYTISPHLLCLIAFAYCVVKIFFQNIKRGGILLVQMAVGSLYMFSVPRGYTDGFNQWCKQVAAICLTAFLQTSLLFLGLLTFPDHMLLGLGIMLAANEVPRIAQQLKKQSR